MSAEYRRYYGRSFGEVERGDLLLVAWPLDSSRNLVVRPVRYARNMATNCYVPTSLTTRVVCSFAGTVPV